MPPLPLPTTEQPRPPATADSLPWCHLHAAAALSMCSCRPRVAQRGCCHHAVLRGVVFARCCTAVVFVVSGGGRLRAALHRRCLRTALCGHRSVVLSSRSVTQLLSSRGVAWRRLCVAQGSSLHGRRLHVPLHGGCCLRIAVVVAVLSSAWSRSSSLPVTEQSRAEGAHTFPRPHKRRRGLCRGGA
jgi:hypothetical protein